MKNQLPAAHRKFTWFILFLLATQIYVQGYKPPIFSKQFLRKTKQPLLLRKPYYSSQTKSLQQTPSSKQLELHEYISYCSCIYALIKISWKYKSLYYDNKQDTSFLMRLLYYCLPSLLSRLVKHQQLFLYTIETTLEALLYKTIAHCLLACTHDSLSSTFSRMLKKVIPF